MSDIALWEDLANTTVDHYPVQSRNSEGLPSYAATPAATFKARVSDKPVRVRSSRSEGNEVTASGVMWIFGTPNIADIDDKFTYAGQQLGKQPIILAWDAVPDETGIHHVKVYFGHG